MTTVYLQSGTYSIHVGKTGHTHVRSAADEAADLPMAIDCSICEPFLVKEGAVYDVTLVPLTAVQQREKERVEREGNFAMQRAATALADAAAGVVTRDDSRSGRPRRVRRTGG